MNCLAASPPVNPEWFARTVNFLANDGQYYAGQVMFLSSEAIIDTGGLFNDLK